MRSALSTSDSMCCRQMQPRRRELCCVPIPSKEFRFIRRGPQSAWRKSMQRQSAYSGNYGRRWSPLPPRSRMPCGDWWNRIPFAAWALMLLIAVLCCAMVGYSGGRSRSRSATLFILPLIVSIALFLIADIDSPRGGIIHVAPQNLLSLRGSF